VTALAQACPPLCCDRCEWPMAAPQHCIDQGEIIGLLICSECIEDDLAARNLELQP
jgi:hypothetical protein